MQFLESLQATDWREIDLTTVEKRQTDQIREAAREVIEVDLGCHHDERPKRR